MSRTLFFLLPIALTAFVPAALCAENSENQSAPPSRAGRVSAVEGRIAVRGLGDQTWVDAEMNFPVTADMEFTTDPTAHAELQLGGIAVAIDGGTTVAVETLDDDTTALFVEAGRIDVRVRLLSPDDHVNIETPQGNASLQDVGTYRIDVTDNANTTHVASFDGRADVETSNGHQVLAADEALEVGDDRHVTAIHVAAVALDDWAAEREKRLEDSASARYVSIDVPGYEELDGAGTWQTTSDYGAVWTPAKVPADWAPYQDGRWAWIAPWGWTWIDSMPWGFAPSHYGRWIFLDGRWAWSPGKRLRHSAYVPAVVGFDGMDPSRFATRQQPPRHWVALGPGEIYRAPYTRDITYLRKVNKGVVSGSVLAEATWDTEEWPTFANIDHVHLGRLNVLQKVAEADKSQDKPSDKFQDKSQDQPVSAAAESPSDDPTQMVLHIPMIEARRLNLVPEDANTPNGDGNNPANIQQHDHPVTLPSAKLAVSEKGGDPRVHPELEDQSGLVDPLPALKESGVAVEKEQIEVVHDVPLSRPVLAPRKPTRHIDASATKSKGETDKIIPARQNEESDSSKTGSVEDY